MDDHGDVGHEIGFGATAGPSTGVLAVAGRGAFVRDRAHRLPGRRHALKVLYDDAEVASVRSAALLAGLTPTGFVAAAGLTVAGSEVAPATAMDRAVLAELLQARTALRRYGVNLNRAVAALDSGAGGPCGCCRRCPAAPAQRSGWTRRQCCSPVASADAVPSRGGCRDREGVPAGH
jgi:hypothetical protein